MTPLSARLGVLALVLTSASPRARAGDEERDEALAKAEASVNAEGARIRGDRSRPIYHVLPPAYWNNDPNGPLFYKGAYHLFYQQNPYGETWGNMHWGHARSTDLAHWEHLPIALWPSKASGEEHVFSGSAVLGRDGRPMLFYTSIGKSRLPEQWAAVPEDDTLFRWKKHPANPILTESLHGGVKVHEWRDPFLFAHGGRTYMVLGGNLNASKGGEAVVTVYRAEDDSLTRWTYLGVLFRHPDPGVKNIECPNFFKLGDRWVLIVSQGRPVQYFVGTLDAATMAFHAEHRGIVDHGNFYAPNCMEDGSGRRLLWGWIDGFPKGRGWNGCLTLPRVLTLGPGGLLVQEPAPELRTLRERDLVHADGLPLRDDLRQEFTTTDDRLEILASFEAGDARTVGLKIRRTATGRAGLHAVAGPSRVEDELTVTADGRPPFSARVFLDGSVAEVYTSDNRTVSRVVASVDGPLTVELFAEGGKATVRELAVWRMGSIWTRPGR